MIEFITLSYLVGKLTHEAQFKKKTKLIAGTLCQLGKMVFFRLNSGIFQIGYFSDGAVKVFQQAIFSCEYNFECIGVLVVDEKIRFCQLE